MPQPCFHQLKSTADILCDSIGPTYMLLMRKYSYDGSLFSLGLHSVIISCLTAGPQDFHIEENKKRTFLDDLDKTNKKQVSKTIRLFPHDNPCIKFSLLW